MSTNISSIKMGKRLKSRYLKIEENDCDPLEAILMTLPVSLDKWKAKL